MHFVGNQKIFDFFNQAIDNDQLSHAYCLVGPRQIGKATLVQNIAGKLLNLEINKLKSSPDYYFLQREINPKTEKLRKNINIKQIRELKIRLGGKSWSGGYRVAIIDGAQYLNGGASNALLKVLEEGGDKLVFFLLTTNDNLLLSTVRSRCQLFYLALVHNKIIEEYLVQQGCDLDKSQQISQLALGLPGRAVELYQNKDLLLELETNRKKWQKISQLSLNEKLKLFPEVFNGKSVDKEKLLTFITDWQIVWRKALLNIVEKKLDQKVQKKVVTFLDFLSQAKILLQQNVNPGLVLEEIMLRC